MLHKSIMSITNLGESYIQEFRKNKRIMEMKQPVHFSEIPTIPISIRYTIVKALISIRPHFEILITFFFLFLRKQNT